MATLRGYGPRFLHSIGQLYKGGPANGMFVVFVKASYGRLAIPGQVYDFGQLIAAQAIGDSQALIQRKLPTLVIAVDGNPAEGLEVFASAINRVLK
jgi:transaldolase/glucose-6-phosphate isomerase